MGLLRLLIVLVFILMTKGDPVEEIKVNLLNEAPDDNEETGDSENSYIPRVENIPPGWDGYEVIINDDIIINKVDDADLWIEYKLPGYEKLSLNNYKRAAVPSEESLWLNPAGKREDIPVKIHHLGKLESLELDMPDFNTLWSLWPCSQSLDELINAIGGDLTNISHDLIHDSSIRLSWTLNKRPGHEITNDYGLSSVLGLNGLKYFYTEEITRYLRYRYNEPVTGQQLSEFEEYQGIMVMSYQSNMTSSTSYDVFLLDQSILSCTKTLSLGLKNVQFTMWVGGDMEYVANLRNPLLGIQPLANAIANYHQKTCIRFRPFNDNDEHYLRVVRGNRVGLCASAIGKTTSSYVPYQTLYLGKGCWLKKIIIHELFHAIGFSHEQDRPDRNHYLQILWHNIRKGKL
uniref:Metalloendopeptidase n=1 Tax=Pachycerianthus borealis TaxID=2736680 RepID=A0A7G7WYN9_9CNID|nr:toxin candidate TRINITY_DN12844_c0_g1_i1 [Pachycerianthus borealis]